MSYSLSALTLILLQAAMSLERVMEYCNLEPEPEWGEVNKDSGTEGRGKMHYISVRNY